jgi:colicin import membrane protein
VKPDVPKLRRRDEGGDLAGGSGLISTASIAAYNGSVSEHLSKYQRDPRPRSRRTQWRAIVSFSIDAKGYVTEVSLAKGTGSNVIDEEMIAMVRRASPFPAPPDGEAKKFDVPVRIDLK